jgi:hypothetical protein
MRYFYPLTWSVLILFSITAWTARSELTVESAIRYGGFGFDSSRNASDTDIDRIGIEELSFRVTFPFLNSFSLVSGYKYHTLFQSKTFAHLVYRTETLKAEGGFSLGFKNDLPLNLVPGIYGSLDAMLRRNIRASFWGHTSLFIQPLFSLSPREYEFDQNQFGIACSFLLRDAVFSLLCKNEGLLRETSPGTITSYGKKGYEISIMTRLTDFWLNSRTAFGSDVHDFKEGSTRHRLIALYIEETLFFSLGQFELSTGMKCNISNTPLEDISSEASVPTPSFSFSTGVSWKKKMKSHP